MKVALYSAQPKLGDVAANLATIAKEAAARKADLVVFPELFATGYNIGDDAQRLALSVDDERLAPVLAACAKAKVHAVFGAPRKARAGVTHNSAFLVAPNKEVQVYDKRCLATYTTFNEGLFFRPGTTSPVWETELGTIGPGICYDLFFPEFHKRQVLAGADILLNISASPTTSQRFFETMFPARAIENAAFMLYCNNAGAQDGLVFWGGAQAWGPRGTLLGRVEPLKRGKVVVDLDMDDLVPAREFRPTLRDSHAEDLAA